MAVRTDFQETTAGAGGSVAFVLARVVVPLWLSAGAVLKLMDLSPAHLPAAIIKWFGGNGIDLLFVLRLSIATELIVAGVMVLLPPLARWIGVAMLATFLPVLIGDLALGASSCGCYGAIEVNPWVTLVIDVTFLLGLLFLGRGEPRLALTRDLPTSKGADCRCLEPSQRDCVAFGLSAPGPTVDGGSADVGSLNVQALPCLRTATTCPSIRIGSAAGSTSFDVAAWTSNLPDDLSFGLQYVIFYRKDCEHCHELMELLFQWISRATDHGRSRCPNATDFRPKTCSRSIARNVGSPNFRRESTGFCRHRFWCVWQTGVVECVAEVEPTAPECLSW